MKFLPPIIAIDAGRSAVKVAYSSGTQTGEFIFPSVVTKARHLSNEQTAMNAKKETVTVDGVDYFVGQTAIEQTAGATYIGLSDEWTDRPEYKALVASAMAKIAQRGVQFHSSPVIVVGAPSNVFSSKRESICQRTKEAVGGDLEVVVLPQAGGAYYSHVFDSSGDMQLENMFFDGPTSPLRNYAVVEVGHFSTDFILFLNGNVNESTFQSTSGVFEAQGELEKQFKETGIKTNAALLNEAFMTRKIHLYGQPRDVAKEVATAIEPFIEKVKNKTESLYADYAQSLSGILIAGGGASLIYPELVKVYPHAILLENSRMTVANGFMSVTKAMLKKREQAKKRAA